MAIITLDDRFKQTIQWVIDQQNHVDSRYMFETPLQFLNVNALKNLFYRNKYKRDHEQKKYYRALRNRLFDKVKINVNITC